MLASTGGHRIGPGTRADKHTDQEVTMSAELIAIIAAAVGLGGLTIATTGSIRSDMRGLADRLTALEHQVGALAERVARLEGTLDVLRQYFSPRRDTDQTEGAA